MVLPSRHLFRETFCNSQKVTTSPLPWSLEWKLQETGAVPALGHHSILSYEPRALHTVRTPQVSVAIMMLCVRSSEQRLGKTNACPVGPLGTGKVESGIVLVVLKFPIIHMIETGRNLSRIVISMSNALCLLQNSAKSSCTCVLCCNQCHTSWFHWPLSWKPSLNVHHPSIHRQ